MAGHDVGRLDRPRGHKRLSPDQLEQEDQRVDGDDGGRHHREPGRATRDVAEWNHPHVELPSSRFELKTTTHQWPRLNNAPLAEVRNAESSPALPNSFGATRRAVYRNVEGRVLARP